jgi:hypothetical protein
VWGNELGRGAHSQQNLPIVMLGLNGRGLPNCGVLAGVWHARRAPQHRRYFTE